MICPFGMFHSGGVEECPASLCRAWSKEFGCCILLLPFQEFAKDMKKERENEVK